MFNRPAHLRDALRAFPDFAGRGGLRRRRRGRPRGCPVSYSGTHRTRAAAGSSCAVPSAAASCWAFRRLVARPRAWWTSSECRTAGLRSTS